MRRIGWAFVLAIGLLHVPVLHNPPLEEIARTSTLVRFDFTDGSLVESGGRLVLRSAAMGGGEVMLVPQGDGWALEFPQVCSSPPTACPRVILESDRVDWLNPGTQPVKWGAKVQMASDRVSEGANVVQKGLSAVGTQFKLQVDGAAGHPSCVMSGPIDGVHRIFVALSHRGIADSRWHEIACERDGEALRLFIDGVMDAETIVPSTLSIVNDLPLRVGGKGVGPHNDQFHGVLDNVFVEIG
ncbi:LamG-like jellyroll fold domain-containing protein [Allorhizocola rhizosphaerae]|uniref:LamG-like jellyroll fold domain-containing protein n=1 Tax=Allorhizocola rhizosphaerae TaxID=1872709 RepID=UPI000E3BDF5A|nr:LamG-like jellyroll fold domain-containing protein [Allorhizocola rhizosphaerae]